jgi:microcystin-dependent protein
MGLISPTLPTPGQPNASEDLDVLAALTTIRDAINGGLDRENLSAALQAFVAEPGDLTVSARTAKTGWLLCDGSAVSRVTYSALWAVIGGTYGAGDGSTTFNLPDLRGRVPVHPDAGAGRLTANNAIGNSGGEAAHLLTIAELPANFRGLQTGGGTEGTAAGAGSNATNGGGGAHNNMPPYLVLNHFIKT